MQTVHGQAHATSDSGREIADVDTSGDDYARRFAGPVGAWMLDVQLRVARGLLPPAPAPLLDVGGGHGQLAVPMTREGRLVTVLGSDISCRRRIAEAIRTGLCRFSVGDVNRLPFPDRSFPAVLCFRLLTHCLRWRDLVGELCRVSGGMVVADYPTSEGLNRYAGSLFRAKKRIESNTRPWMLFRHGEIRDAFAEHGFVVDRREPQFLLPMVLHRVLRCRPLSAALEAAARRTGLTRRFGSPVILRATLTPSHTRPPTPTHPPTPTQES